MAATQTVPQHLPDRNLPTEITPWRGVVTLYGYGIQAYVERGHLILKDGIGSDRREARFARVGHGLRRLVVIGADGMVSLAALRWLADQDASFVMLERDGSVLVTTGPVRPSDARLRRAQALAHQSGTALRIVRELIRQKIVMQEQLVRQKLGDPATANTIAERCPALASAETIEAIRFVESQAALAYWSAWRNVPIHFPSKQLNRVPDHWRKFGTRRSLLSGSPRLAVNPPNAMLNYLYALLESEARLAAATLGLDPGLGLMHFDSKSRDSLASDLMEPVRPKVDAYLLDWITREPVRREWFFERPDGNCRLMGSFAMRLSETATTWGRTVAPIAEWVSHNLSSSLPRPARQLHPATRLTQGRRRAAKAGSVDQPYKSPPKLPRVCRSCGAPVNRGSIYCPPCGVTVAREGLIEVARLGRVAAHTPEVKAQRAATQRRQSAARLAWNSSDKPEWLTAKVYRESVLPRLAGITVSAIATAMGVSGPYAADIRVGKHTPHSRHWMTLARLAGVHHCS